MINVPDIPLNSFPVVSSYHGESLSDHFGVSHVENRWNWDLSLWGEDESVVLKFELKLGDVSKRLFSWGGGAIVVCFCWTGSNGKSSKVDDLLMTSIKKATRFFRQRFFSPGMGLKRYTSYPRKGFFANSLKTFAEEQRKLWSQVGEWRSIRVQWWRCLVESSKGRKCTTQAQSCRGEIGVSTNSRFCLKDLIFPSLIWSLPDPESMKAGWNKSFCPSTLSRTTGSENAKSSPRTRWACCPSLTLKQKLRII